METRLFLIVLVIIVSFAGHSFGGDDPVLASAGELIFKKSDFDRLMSYSPPYLREQLNNDPKQKEMLIRKIMHHRIISEMARKEGLDKRADVMEQLGYVIDDFLSKEYIAQNIIDKIKIKDEELKDYYEKNISRFTSPEQVKARHILIKVPFGASLEDKAKARDKIKNILEWLKKGEKFETLAEQYSEDITSNKKGGELGYFQRGRMPKAFDDMAFSMKPGQISDVVETDYGYHIIEVQDKREAKTKTFEEVKDSIRQQLTEEITRKKIDEFIQKIEKDSGFKVYTERLIEKR